MKNSILFFLTLLLLYSLTSCFEQGDNSSTNFQNKDKNEVNFNDNKIKEINKEISGLLLELTQSNSPNKELIDSITAKYDEIIALKPNEYKVYISKAQLYVKLCNFESAIEIFEKVQGIKPDYAEIITYEGFLYYRLGNYKKARELFKKSLIIYSKRIENTNKVEDKINKAYMYIFLGDKQKANAELEKLKLENPNSEHVLNMVNMAQELTIDSYLESILPPC
tara:strand:+ start:2429 stop:3097 length:669 start_codon:yes stop_codon:yes gene_type:complete